MSRWNKEFVNKRHHEDSLKDSLVVVLSLALRYTNFISVSPRSHKPTGYWEPIPFSYWVHMLRECLAQILSCFGYPSWSCGCTMVHHLPWLTLKPGLVSAGTGLGNVQRSFHTEMFLILFCSPSEWGFRWLLIFQGRKKLQASSYPQEISAMTTGWQVPLFLRDTQKLLWSTSLQKLVWFQQAVVVHISSRLSNIRSNAGLVDIQMQI